GPRSAWRRRSPVLTAPREPRRVPVAVAVGAGAGWRLGWGEGEFAGWGEDGRGWCPVDGTAVPPGPLVGPVGPGPGKFGQHRGAATADQQRVAVGQFPQHRGVADVVAAEPLVAFFAEGGLPAQLAGGLEQRGVGDPGQEDLAAGGVADDLRALLAPAFAELAQAVANDRQ